MAKLEPKWASQKFVTVEPVVENSGSFNVQAGKVHVVADGQGALNATLPVAANGLNVFVKALVSNIDTNTVTIVPQGLSKIDGVAASYVMSSDKQTLHLVSDGTDWYII